MAISLSVACHACRRRRRISVGLNTLLVLAVWDATTARAQIQSATLVGTVRDSSGAVLTGAEVRVDNMGTQFRWKTLTNAEGDYTVPYLSPGSYRITLEAKGFKTLIRDNIVIRTGETPRVDI